MPVIRYRTRDLTRLLPGTARPGMRRMEKITGRTDDMIILRGVNLFPTQIEEIVLRTPGLSPHFQLVLTTRGRMDHLTVAGRGAAGLPGRAPRPGGRRGGEGGQGHRRHERRGARGRPGDAAAVGGQAAAAGRPPGPVRDDRRRSGRRAARALAGLAARRRRRGLQRARVRRHQHGGARRAGSASPSRRSTTTCRARSSCCGWRWTGRWTRCSRSPRSPGATDGPAIARLEHVVRGSVRVLAEELPFVTLLLRRARQLRRSSRRRCSAAGSSTGSSPHLVRAARAARATCGPTSTPR